MFGGSIKNLNFYEGVKKLKSFGIPGLEILA